MKVWYRTLFFFAFQFLLLSLSVCNKWKRMFFTMKWPSLKKKNRKILRLRRKKVRKDGLQFKLCKNFIVRSFCHITREKVQKDWNWTSSSISSIWWRHHQEEKKCQSSHSAMMTWHFCLWKHHAAKKPCYRTMLFIKYVSTQCLSLAFLSFATINY